MIPICELAADPHNSAPLPGGEGSLVWDCGFLSSCHPMILRLEYGHRERPNFVCNKWLNLVVIR